MFGFISKMFIGLLSIYALGCFVHHWPLITKKL